MLDKNFIGSLLDEALSTGGDFAEIYVEDTESNALTMLGGTVYKASAGRDYGVGVRIFDGYNAIYAYTCGSDKEEIAKIVKKAAQALKKDGRIQRAELKEDIIDNIHIIQIPPHKIDDSGTQSGEKRRFFDFSSQHQLLGQQKAYFGGQFRRPIRRRR
jgi:TldD protein